MEVKISNGRCKACDVEFGGTEYDEELCSKCLQVSMTAAHGKQANDSWYSYEDDEQAMEKIMEAYDEYIRTTEVRDEWGL